MKTLCIFLFLCISTVVAQTPGWTDLMETNLSIGNNNYDIFTNRFGNHIIVQESNALKYYKMDVYGDATSNYSPTTLESSAVISPSISGDETRIYVVYRKENESSIKTKFSSDGGLNWSTLATNPQNSNASSIECVFSKGLLHVTYLVEDVEDAVVYFSYYNTNNLSWLAYQAVSNENYTAAYPRIGINNTGNVDTVYFTFNHNEVNQLRWRRFIVGGNLSSIQAVNTGFGFLPENLGFAVDNKFIYAFFKLSTTQIIAWYVRRIWDNNPIGQGNSNSNTYVQKIFSTTTAENNPYMAAWSTITGFENSIVRMGFNGSTSLDYDLIHTETGLTPVNIVNLSAAGNDVHVIWKDNLSNDYLRYKYYDDFPLIPYNLVVTAVDFGRYSHPVLTWTLNNAPDVYVNSTGYEIQRRTRQVPGNFGNWSTVDYTAGNINSYTDNEIIIEGTGTLYQAEFRVRAIDVRNYMSDWSSTVSIYFGQFGKISNGMQRYEFELSQNYPNPFNPSTTINYSIKSTGMVTLKVYDILGTEVASLVNEMKEPGNYSVLFNAANLPSGMYVYILSTGNFIDTKKLILLK